MFLVPGANVPLRILHYSVTRFYSILQSQQDWTIQNITCFWYTHISIFKIGHSWCFRWHLHLSTLYILHFKIFMNTCLLHTFVSTAHKVQWLLKKHRLYSTKLFYFLDTHDRARYGIHFVLTWMISIIDYPLSLDMCDQIYYTTLFLLTHTTGHVTGPTFFWHARMSVLQNPLSLDIQDQARYRTQFLFTCKIKHITGPTFCWHIHIIACYRTHFVFTCKIKHVTGPSFLDMQNWVCYKAHFLLTHTIEHVTENLLPLALHDQARYRTCTRPVSNNMGTDTITNYNHMTRSVWYSQPQTNEH
jgi:hypothetical protein